MDSRLSFQAWPRMRSAAICSPRSLSEHLLHPSSQTYFGFQWHGFFFVFRTLSFAWKAGAFVYHKLGLAVSGSERSLGVPVSQYIDDRQVGQLFILHFGLAGALLLSEHKQPLISCVICSLRLDISSLLENGSWFLQHGLVF